MPDVTKVLTCPECAAHIGIRGTKTCWSCGATLPAEFSAQRRARVQDNPRIGFFGRLGTVLVIYAVYAPQLFIKIVDTGPQEGVYGWAFAVNAGLWCFPISADALFWVGTLLLLLGRLNAAMKLALAAFFLNLIIIPYILFFMWAWGAHIAATGGIALVLKFASQGLLIAAIGWVDLGEVDAANEPAAKP